MQGSDQRTTTFHDYLLRTGNLFVAPHRSRSALATHVHRFRAMAHRNIVTSVVA
ncbi:hypothetical protein BHMPCIPO_04356 [Ensifer sesbaniae]|nr:hypothetical protein [Ensifer sesbaniae]